VWRPECFDIGAALSFIVSVVGGTKSTADCHQVFASTDDVDVAVTLAFDLFATTRHLKNGRADPHLT
jgi:hypothetical protein